MIGGGPPVSLRTQKRDAAGGIADDDFSLCTTPPEQSDGQQQ